VSRNLSDPYLGKFIFDRARYPFPIFLPFFQGDTCLPPPRLVQALPFATPAVYPNRGSIGCPYSRKARYCGVPDLVALGRISLVIILARIFPFAKIPLLTLVVRICCPDNGFALVDVSVEPLCYSVPPPLVRQFSFPSDYFEGIFSSVLFLNFHVRLCRPPNHGYFYLLRFYFSRASTRHTGGLSWFAVSLDIVLVLRVP